MISAIGGEKMILNGIRWGSVAEWFGAIGTIGAVWLAINYRRTKVKFDVDAVFKVVVIPMAGELPVNISSPQLEIDIFNINDPDLMIKDIAIIHQTTRLSIIKDGPIIIKGFEARRIDFVNPGDWRLNIDQYNEIKDANAKLVINLFGNKDHYFKIDFKG